MAHEPRLTERGALLVLAAHPRVGIASIGPTLQRAFTEAYGHLEALGVEPAGPPFVIYGEPVEGGDSFAIDVCVPVTRAVDPPPGWTMEQLPAGRFAALVHVGPYDGLGAAYEQLASWIGRQGLTVAGPPREVYLSEPSTPPDRTRTIVEFPVAPAVATVPHG